jgi:hypothetical protein
MIFDILKYLGCFLILAGIILSVINVIEIIIVKVRDDFVPFYEFICPLAISSAVIAVGILILIFILDKV